VLLLSHEDVLIYVLGDVNVLVSHLLEILLNLLVVLLAILDKEVDDVKLFLQLEGKVFEFLLV
jgi:hypothetical protein